MAFGVVAFAFGVPSSIHSNQMIAWIAARNAVDFKAPILTQQDIQFGEGYEGLDVTYVTETPGQPPPTLRIARAAIQWALRKNVRMLVVVAAGPHLWRCMRDMKAAAKEAGWPNCQIQPACQISKYADDTWFRPESFQKRTRSKKEWRKREAVLELIPFFVYKLVAS